jgi:hypothetical protein
VMSTSGVNTLSVDVEFDETSFTQVALVDKRGDHSMPGYGFREDYDVLYKNECKLIDIEVAAESARISALPPPLLAPPAAAAIPHAAALPAVVARIVLPLALTPPAPVAIAEPAPIIAAPYLRRPVREALARVPPAAALDALDALALMRQAAAHAAEVERHRRIEFPAQLVATQRGIADEHMHRQSVAALLAASQQAHILKPDELDSNDDDYGHEADRQQPADAPAAAPQPAPAAPA